MDEVKPVARVPTVEHREPCESRGSRTVLGAPGGEIPPGDSTFTSVRARDVDFRFTLNTGRFSASQRTVETGQKRSKRLIEGQAIRSAVIDLCKEW